LTKRQPSAKILPEWKYIILEVCMSRKVTRDHRAEFREVFRRFMRLQRRLKDLLPRDVARARDQMHRLFSPGKASAADYDLFYNLGLTIARQPEPLTMGEISQALSVPLSTATRLVDLLVKNEFAQRLPDPNDRRVVRVSLTKTGKTLYQALDGFIAERVEQLLHPFTVAERETLIALMTKLVTALEQET
jgi:DNA-binding MarR family transcriptional regulator